MGLLAVTAATWSIWISIGAALIAGGAVWFTRMQGHAARDQRADEVADRQSAALTAHRVRAEGTKREYLLIANRGRASAQNATVRLESQDGSTLGVRFEPDSADPAEVNGLAIPSGSSVGLSIVLYHGANTTRTLVEMTWDDLSGRQSAVQTLGAALPGGSDPTVNLWDAARRAGI